MNDSIELSVVMPCLNEAETLGSCIDKAKQAIAEHGIAAEIIVADNGSTDGSQELAESMGARVVNVESRGYGSALMGGIAAARGTYILMGDADDSYDFSELPRFLERIREGFDLVQGCRLPAGGGQVLAGAMPFWHRWVGNPFFSWLARKWFGVPIHDIYCGMRAFRRDAYERWDLRCTGMEFATEMIIKSSLRRNPISEVPITLHPDGRTINKPHLKTIRDGWRTLRFFMFSCPRWLFLVPGGLLMGLGVIGYLAGYMNWTIGQVAFDLHTLLVSSLFVILGFQSILFAAFTLIYAIQEGFLPPDPRVSWLVSKISMERGLLIGAGTFSLGILLLLRTIWVWEIGGFGELDYQTTMPWVIPGVMLAALGFQAVLSGAFISILGMGRRR